jgi:hypothetical protein
MRSLEPWIDQYGDEIMDRCCVNLFSPLLPPCSAYLGPENTFLDDTLVPTSELCTWSKLRLGLHPKLSFGLILRRSQRVPCWLRGSEVVLTAGRHVTFQDEELYLFCDTKPARFI